MPKTSSTPCWPKCRRCDKDLGYPPLVTPTSQIVGSQAAFNVMTGKRYSVVAMETRNYVMGLYGEPPGPISDEMKAKVLGKKAADHLPAGRSVEAGP